MTLTKNFLSTLVFDFSSDQGLEFSVLSSEISTVLTASSTIVFSGLVTITNNPDNIPLTDLVFSIEFSFGENPPPVSPDSNGLFSFTLTTRADLSFPEVGTLSLLESTTNSTPIAVSLTTPDLFSVEIDQEVGKVGDLITISGSTDPNNTVFLASELFASSTVNATETGFWSFEFVVPPLNLDTYSIQVENHTLEFEIIELVNFFNPQLINRNFDTTRILDNWVGTIPNVALPGEIIELTLFVGSTIFALSRFTTNESGDLTPNTTFILPATTEGQIATQRFRQISTNNSVDLTYTVPIFNPDTSLNSPSSLLIQGETSLLFSVNRTPGFTAEVELVNFVSQNLPATTISGNFLLSYGISEGIHTLVANSPEHNSTSNTIEIIHGVFGEFAPKTGLLFPGDTFTLNINSRANDTVSVVVGTNTYTVDIDANNQGELIASVPLDLPFGNNNFILTSQANNSVYQASLFIDDPADYSLSSNNPGTILTNSRETSLVLTGLALPGERIFIDLFLLNDEILGDTTADSFGNWTFELDLDWRPATSYSLLINGGTLTFNGLARPDVRIEQPVVLAEQDEIYNPIARGDRFEEITFTFGSLAPPQTITSDLDGFARANSFVIPVTTPTKSVILINATNGILADSLLLEVQPRIPLNLIVAPFYFTNSINDLDGDAPSNLPLNISAVGGDITLNSQGNDQFFGTLNTGSSPGLISFLLSTPFQPTVEFVTSIVEPLSLVVPLSLDSEDPPIDFTAITAPNLEINYQINLLSSSGDIYNSFAGFEISDSEGRINFNFNPSLIATPGIIEVEVFSFPVFKVSETIITTVDGQSAYSPPPFNASGLVSYITQSVQPDSFFLHNVIDETGYNPVSFLSIIITTANVLGNRFGVRNESDSRFLNNTTQRVLTNGVVERQNNDPSRNPTLVPSSFFTFSFSVAHVLASTIAPTVASLPLDIRGRRNHFTTRSRNGIDVRLDLLPEEIEQTVIMTYRVKRSDNDRFFEEAWFINGRKVGEVNEQQGNFLSTTIFDGEFSGGRNGRTIRGVHSLWARPLSDQEIADQFDENGQLIPLRASKKRDFAQSQQWAIFNHDVDPGFFGTIFADNSTNFPVESDLYAGAVPISSLENAARIQNGTNRPTKTTTGLSFNGSQYLQIRVAEPNHYISPDYIAIIKRSNISAQEQCIFETSTSNTGNNIEMSLFLTGVDSFRLVRHIYRPNSFTSRREDNYTYTPDFNEELLVIRFQYIDTVFSDLVHVSVNNVPANRGLVSNGSIGNNVPIPDPLTMTVGCTKEIDKFFLGEILYVGTTRPCSFIQTHFGGTFLNNRPLYQRSREALTAWICFILGYPQFWQALHPTHHRSLDGIFYI